MFNNTEQNIRKLERQLKKDIDGYSKFMKNKSSYAARIALNYSILIQNNELAAIGNVLEYAKEHIPLSKYKIIFNTSHIN